MTVHPKYQHCGLAKRIMHEIEAYLIQVVDESAVVKLLADKHTHRLYEQFGFHLAAPTSMGMIWYQPDKENEHNRINPEFLFESHLE
ncbi:GNAT family N-acetyltransferase [Listeria ilorinensis]|uniref:GNAT family N-acetyltransferase n=1 Tax=Listeria ilorinensis TaxID=2867439 RepID=UPI0025A63864|nr:GNAT family N-acetyltransferase [Listeria ilorinensis]